MHPPMNPPTTHPMNPPTTPPPSTTHPMNHPKYMYSDRMTLWICLMGGWVGVHKIKSFNIVTLYGWVSVCIHPMNPSTIHPPCTPPPHTHTLHEPSNHPPHELSNHPSHHPLTHPINPPTIPPPPTTHSMNHPNKMCSDRVTLWICLMGGWVFIK